MAIWLFNSKRVVAVPEFPDGVGLSVKITGEDDSDRVKIL